MNRNAPNYRSSYLVFCLAVAHTYAREALRAPSRKQRRSDVAGVRHFVGGMTVAEHPVDESVRMHEALREGGWLPQ